jgi:pimeloyl-ACP methyl ester carboxylesterase
MKTIFKAGINLLALCVLIASSACATSQPTPETESLPRRYEGQLVIGDIALTMVLRQEPGSDIVLFDSPDEGVYGIESIPFGPFPTPEFSIEFPRIGVTFSGTIGPEGKLVSTLQQGPASLPITFIPKSQAYESKLPPRPVSLEEDEITVQAPNAKLAVSISKPRADQKDLMALIISGSGPQDRDAMIFGQKTNLILANGLYEAGFHTVRFDERGQGKSTGNMATADTYDLTEDITAILKTLRERYPGIKLGVVGLSEGGLISTILAGRELVDFAVLMAAPSSTGSQVLLQQTEALLAVSGMEETRIAETLAITKQVHDLVLAKGQESRQYSSTSEALKQEIIELYSEKTDFDQATIQSSANTLSSPWFRTFLALDPLPYFLEIDVPILALTGTKDLQVLMDPNFLDIQSVLGSRDDFDAVVFEDLNHVFQQAETGSVSEYLQPNPMIEQRVISTITAWLDQL